MKRYTRTALLLLPLLLIVGARAADPPEVVSSRIGSADFGARNPFQIDPIPAPLLEKIRTSTWHAGCPVSPEDLRQLTLPVLELRLEACKGHADCPQGCCAGSRTDFTSLYHHGFLIEKNESN